MTIAMTRRRMSPNEMIIRFAVCLLVVSVLAACQSTTTTKRETLREMNARYASSPNPNISSEPAPPAEGPEEVSGDRSSDPVRNPALLPTPLLRRSAAGSL